VGATPHNNNYQRALQVQVAASSILFIVSLSHYSPAAFTVGESSPMSIGERAKPEIICSKHELQNMFDFFKLFKIVIINLNY
jgi:hypothetical protein